MTIFHKIRLFLVVFLILGFCVSCGKKPAPVEPPKKPKKKREKVVPPPVEEVQPVKEEIPPLPEDVSTWKKADFLRARQENHKSLMDACMSLGKTQSTKEANQDAIKTLLAVLKPVDPPEMEELTEPDIEGLEESEARDKQREYEDKVREQEKILQDLPKLDTRRIDYIIDQIALIGTTDAWETLLSVWRQEVKTDDDSNIDQTVLKAILDHPQTNNKDIVFDLIVDPESLVLVQKEEEKDEQSSRKFEDSSSDNRNRNVRERRTLEPEKVFEEAMKWAQKYADEEFRVKLAKYLVDGTNEELSEERTNKIVAFLMEKNLSNFSAQILFYPDFLSETELRDFNAFLEKCSASAYAALTDQCVADPETLLTAMSKGNSDDQEESGRRRRSRATAADKEKNQPAQTENQEKQEQQEGSGNADEQTETTETSADNTDIADNTDKASDENKSDESKSDEETDSAENREPEEAFSALEPFEVVKINDSYPQITMIEHPEFALQVLRLIWSKDYIDQQRQTFMTSVESQENQSESTALSFLLSLPFKGEQSYWFDFLNERWDVGPEPLRQSAFLAPKPINPGLLLSVKMLKRLAVPEKKNVKKNSQSNEKLSGREQTQQTSYAWMSFTKEMVIAEMGRLVRAAEYQKFTQRDVSKLKKVMPFKVPEGAEIVSEYHFLLPNSTTKKVAAWEFDPLEIHFVRIKWDIRQIEIAKRIKYKNEVSLTMRNCPETKNVWLECFKESDTLIESMDVIINNVETYEPTESDEYVVDILTLRSKKPTEE